MKLSDPGGNISSVLLIFCLFWFYSPPRPVAAATVSAEATRRHLCENLRHDRQFHAGTCFTLLQRFIHCTWVISSYLSHKFLVNIWLEEMMKASHVIRFIWVLARSILATQFTDTFVPWKELGKWCYNRRDLVYLQHFKLKVLPFGCDVSSLGELIRSVIFSLPSLRVYSLKAAFYFVRRWGNNGQQTTNKTKRTLFSPPKKKKKIQVLTKTRASHASILLLITINQM